ncbi:MAG: superfamily hydrolase [Parcubacteria group bacterium]|nr:superfamily hydrolase [Parcubacteria group bacterium]
MPITTLIFDCFGVVCQPVLNGWYKQHHERTGFVDENLSDVFKKLDLGTISEDDVLTYFSQYEGALKNTQELREEIDSFLGLDTEVVKTIEELKAKGYKIALLSNGNNGFFERKIYTTYPEFKGLFNAIVISSNVRLVKPDPEIYMHTLKEVGSKPEETIFIDDSQPNVDAASKLGIQGHFYTDSSSLRAYLKEIGLL